MARKKWQAPNNPTPQAKQVWKAIYGEPWPKGWTVKWAGFMRNRLGLCCYGPKTIVLSYGDAVKGTRGKYDTSGDAGCILTLIHEFVHVRNGWKLRHGKEFQRLVRWGWERLVPPAQGDLEEEAA